MGSTVQLEECVIKTETENLKTGETATFKFALAAAEMAANTRGEQVVLLDLRGRSQVTEFFVIATGTSPRQMRTVAEEIQDLGKKMGFKAWQVSGLESARWILVDCVTVVAHVFEGEAREFYDLEMLWGDCPRIDWRKELGLPAVVEGERIRSRTKFGGAVEVDAELEEARLEGEGMEEMEDDDEEEGDGELIELEVPDEDEGSKLVETEVEGDEAGFMERVEDGDEMEGAMHVEKSGARLEEAIADEEREVVGGGKGAKGRKVATGGASKKKSAPVKKVGKKVVKKTVVKKAVAKKVVKGGVKKAAKGAAKKAAPAKPAAKKKVVKKAVVKKPAAKGKKKK